MKILLSLLCCVGVFTLSAQSRYFKESASWLQKSEACKPVLTYTEHKPVKRVTSIKDASAYQGWRMRDEGSTDLLFNESLKKHPSVIVDFGEHLTGYLDFSLKLLSQQVSDAPVRIKFTFAEVPSELNTPFDPYPGGLSRAWLQDEVMTLMTVPIEASIPRRVSFRYLKIELLGASSFDFAFDKLTFRAQTSAKTAPLPLASTTDPLIRKINEVGLLTLKECMQTVYEDGPKRDRRLWIGDLYLEALANAWSYKNHDLTKRCLYLLAALANDEGLLHATVLETPTPHPQNGTHCLDYSLLYNVALLEYLKETGDKEVALDLWPVVVRQIEMALRQYSDDWIYDMQKKPIYWLVFDWKDNYDRQASMQGLTAFSLEKSYELAKMLGKEKEAGDWPRIAGQIKKAARKTFYDQKNGVIVSGPNRQVSYLSQVWMILSETLTAKEGAKAMATVLSMPDACYPGCPYAYHYVMEALLKCGMRQEARSLLTSYWGGMVNKGADTFWEVYDPNNDELYKIKYQESKRTHLTPEELGRLENLKLDGQRTLRRCLDMFLFSCYTGLRFSDIVSITKENFLIIDDKVWLVYSSVKTDVSVRLPLFLLFEGKSLPIYERYKNAPRTLFGVPLSSNSNVNKQLRRISQLASIDKKVSFHTARHTNATLLLYNGANITTVQKLLGHKSVRTTEIYSNIMDMTIVRDLEKIETRLKFG